MREKSDTIYRPFRQILREVYERYGRPVFVSETGTEGAARSSWFRYICGEVSGAIQAGVPIKGVCLYPVVNFPDWDDERHCYNGLWDYPNTQGKRELYPTVGRRVAPTTISDRAANQCLLPKAGLNGSFP